MNLVELLGKDMKVIVNNDLSLTILGRDREIMWETSRTHIPTMLIRKKSQETFKIALGKAKANVLELGSRKYHGFAIHLDNIGHTDIVMEMVFAIDPTTSELLVQADQVDGTDTVVDIEHLYCFEKRKEALNAFSGRESGILLYQGLGLSN